MTIAFDLPAALSAAQPPEARGLRRDGVRLLVAGPDGSTHGTFADIGRSLRPGDLLVVNTSATLAAAVDGQRADGRAVTVHFATERDDGIWVVELRPPGRAHGPVDDARVGESVRLPAGVTLVLLDAVTDRLWRARVNVEGRVVEYLSRVGRPISYAYVEGSWPLSYYQTVFGRDPGSAEMPSAGRPFSTELVTSLVTQGVLIVPVTLHTGVSSPEAGEPPQPEWFDVPAVTARLVNDAPGRVVAVGTTVTRALESVADSAGNVRPGRGWTDLVLSAERPARVVSGLVTGWHAPGASHLHLLEAVAGRQTVERAYAAALDGGYLWHEFGDSCLLFASA